jgi:hypothetical protein
MPRINGYHGSVKFDLAKLYIFLGQLGLYVVPETIQDQPRDRSGEADTSHHSIPIKEHV